MLRPALSVALFVALSAQLASAQSRPTYIQFDPYTVKGALYRPDGGGDADIGILLIHRVNNYLGHIATSELARRGFLVLAMNSRFDNNEASVLWERPESCSRTTARSSRRSCEPDGRRRARTR